MKQKKIYILLVAFVSLLITTNTRAESDSLAVYSNSDKVYVVRGDKNFPPFEFLNSQGEPDGFDVELFRAMMKELGLKYDLKLINFKDVYKGLTKDSLDIAIGMILNHDRAKIMDFGLAYDTLRYNIISQRAEKYKTLEQLRGKKIVVVERMRPYQYLIANGFIEGRDIIVAKNEKQAIDMVLNGMASAMVSYDMVAIYYINKYKYSSLALSYIEKTPAFAISLAIPKGNDELVYMLNIALHNLKLNGTYDKIYDKWFGLSIAKFQLSELGYYILYTVGGLLLISFIFILLLRYRINRTTKYLRQSNKEMSLALKAGELTLWFLDEKMELTVVRDDNHIQNYNIDYIYSLLNPDDAQNLKMHINNLLSGTQRLDKMILQMRNPDTNENIYIEYYVIVDQYKYDDTKRLIGTYRNVTERQLLDNQLKEYKVRTDILLDGSNMQQWYYNVADDTIYYYGNPCYGNTYIPDEKIIKVIHPEDKEELLRALTIMRNGEDSNVVSEYRLFISQYNEYRSLVTNAFPYEKDKNGKVTRYIGLTRDNTEWNVMMQRMVELKEKAEIANKLKSSFLANMSHEIRTPLNSIVGFSDLLTATTDPEEQAEYNKIIHMNNELLLKLVNDVLDLSKMEAGSMKMDRTEFDISPYFDDLYTNFLPKMRKGVQLQYEKQYESYRVYLDQDRLTQVITNFITNAIKFTEKGFIKLGYKIENGGLKVYVQDTGIGISEENCQRIFERFEKVNSYSQGTGLGLSICKNLIESTSGKIGVDSKEGEGSTFWAWINLENIRKEGENDKDKEDISLQLPNSDTNTSKDTANKKNDYKQEKDSFRKDRQRALILVAEDDESNYLFMKSVLGKKYSLARAKNGIEAIEECRKLYPDLIFMDVKMPQMDGLTATKEIREFDTEVPIIAATAYAYDSDKQKAIAAGCNNYISKPIDTDKMFELINKYKFKAQ